MKTLTSFPKPLIKLDKPVAVLPEAEYESLVETLEVLGDQKLLRRIESALNNLKRGKFFTHNEVFHSKNK